MDIHLELRSWGRSGLFATNPKYAHVYLSQVIVMLRLYGKRTKTVEKTTQLFHRCRRRKI
jgi:hypothetical protein